MFFFNQREVRPLQRRDLVARDLQGHGPVRPWAQKMIFAPVPDPTERHAPSKRTHESVKYFSLFYFVASPIFLFSHSTHHKLPCSQLSVSLLPVPRPPSPSLAPSPPTPPPRASALLFSLHIWTKRLKKGAWQLISHASIPAIVRLFFHLPLTLTPHPPINTLNNTRCRN